MIEHSSNPIKHLNISQRLAAGFFVTYLHKTAHPIFMELVEEVGPRAAAFMIVGQVLAWYMVGFATLCGFSLCRPDPGLSIVLFLVSAIFAGWAFVVLFNAYRAITAFKGIGSQGKGGAV